MLYIDSIDPVEYRVVQNPTIFGIVPHFVLLTLLIRIPTAIRIVDVDLVNYPSTSTHVPVVTKDGHVEFLQVRFAL